MRLGRELALHPGDVTCSMNLIQVQVQRNAININIIYLLAVDDLARLNTFFDFWLF